jgi:putative FmdB family regulatory protein
VPTYEYACKQCGENLEVVQKFTDDPLTECPACGGPLRKVFGNIGISFKGSGFYKNDSRASENGAKKKDAAAADGGSSGGSDTTDKPKADVAAKSDAPKDKGTGDKGKSDKGKSDKGTSTAAAS